MVAGGCCSASLRDWSAQLGSLVFLSQTSQTKPSCCLGAGVSNFCSSRFKYGCC